MKKVTKWILLTLLLLFTTGIIVLVVSMRPREFGVDEIIAQANVDGTRFVLTQSYEGLFEGNNIKFFVEEQTGVWNRYYIEHEDTYWRNANLVSGREVVEIRRGDNAVAFYDLATKRYYLVGRGVWDAGSASASPLDNNLPK